MKKITLLIIGLFLFTSNSIYAYKNTYAVIVAVADYQYMSPGDGDLNFTINDAVKFSKFLMTKEGGSVPKSNIYLLIDEKAKKSNILHYTEKMFKRANKDDRVIFYFSGHGDKGSFIPYDFRYSDDFLFFSEVKKLFRYADANTKLLFADACYSGSIRNSSKDGNYDKSLKNESKKRNNNSKQNIAVMLSSKGDQTSLEMGRLRQGVFSYNLIRGLAGEADKNMNGNITISELFYFVHDETKRIAWQQASHEQTPVLFGNFDARLIIGKNLKNK